MNDAIWTVRAIAERYRAVALSSTEKYRHALTDGALNAAWRCCVAADNSIAHLKDEFVRVARGAQS